MIYAYTTTIKHEYENGLLNIWIIFSKAMKRSSDPLETPPAYDIMPPLAKWLLTADSVVVDITDSAWQDEYTLLLTSDTIAGYPTEVFLAYDGPDESLQTAWDKQWEPWGAILSENVTPNVQKTPFILTANITTGGDTYIYNANAPFAFKVINCWSVNTAAQGTSKGYWKLSNGSGDITSWLYTAEFDQLFTGMEIGRESLNDAYWNIPASGTLKIINDSKLPAICDIFVMCLPA